MRKAGATSSSTILKPSSRTSPPIEPRLRYSNFSNSGARRRPMPDANHRLSNVISDADAPHTLPSPNVPYEVAAVFLERKHYTAAMERTLYWWRNTWMIWRGSYWQELTRTALRAQLYHFTAQATYVN